MGIVDDLENAYIALQNGETQKAMQIIADVVPRVEKLVEIECGECGKPITECDCEDMQ